MASYKSASLARQLTQDGAEVDVILTRSAQEFVGAVTFEALTGRPVHTALVSAGHALDHIRLARAAHVVAVAPATADFLARAASGQADDLLSACLLATQAPVLLVPAMNDRMWEHPQTTRNVAHLREIGYQVLDPDVGELAVGEGSGPGRMPEPEAIQAYVGRLLEPAGPLRGKRVLVTAGPTREPLDPVRFISNRSSGKMGVAIAQSAWRRGADVTLVTGPLGVSAPVGVQLIGVESAAEMRDAVAGALPHADLLVMAAAPSDFRPETSADQKIKRSAAPGAISLAPTEDILQSTAARRRRGAIIVGFALETENVVANGRAKLEAKALDLIVINDATEKGAGFEVDTNRVTLLARGREPDALPLQPKSEVADAILDRVEALMRGS
ncbi:MAG: bifunctional phosphopantothenoylcysteine decarboxylase/phosphopantothenate--cysteine ligase CoaBC [Gemmatimonadaceae bacterium]